ncbi:MAG: anaerobic ribonucleoside-triphosphate reductase activating protein [Lachnospiraceae bacterium]|nr:anaerobic ribonucleoside-triphosphate reductase activating protein [Lachnospiraceae bacterium]
MHIHGLNKLTLLDYPGHLACTVFTGACNFRCPFCHNAPLVLAPETCEAVSEEDFFTFLASRKGKLEGVCITGGEPTLQPDLPDFLKKIREMGFLVKLDTNGYRPEILRQLLTQNLLDMVAMDIKNSREAYAETAGVSGEKFEVIHIEKSISLLLSTGIPHELRTTVTKELHTVENMLALGHWLSSLAEAVTGTAVFSSPYFLQNFKDSGNLICGTEKQFHPLEETELQNLLLLLRPVIPSIRLRGQ